MITGGVRRRLSPWRFVAVLLIATAQGGCVHGRGTVVGRITPWHFRFKTVVSVDANEAQPDGWRAVCIHARITDGDSGATDICKFEVGLPIRNTQQREVSLEVAQHVAAYIANEAADQVLSMAQPGEMIAILCRRFKVEYQQRLWESVAGSRVSECQTRGIETVYFDIPARSSTNE